MAAEHRETEQAIEASGLAYTFLRNSIYADLQPSSAQAAIAVRAAGDQRRSGPHGLRHARGLRRGRGRGARTATAMRARPTTSPAREALNADDLARLYSELGGTPVEVVHVDDAAYAAGLVEHAGMPPHMAEIYATFGAATRSGVLDVTTDVVERLTGRAPANIRSVLWP